MATTEHLWGKQTDLAIGNVPIARRPLDVQRIGRRQMHLAEIGRNRLHRLKPGTRRLVAAV